MMTHPFVTQLRFARSELVRCLEGVSDEDARRHLEPMNCISLGPEEITPNLSLGQTINHIAAVIVPVVGGMVWEAVGAQYTFLAGVAIALLSLMLTLRMRTPRSGLIKAPSPIR
jgi:hypothetical protein